MFGVLIISLLCCFQLGLSDKLLVCQVSGDTCVFTSKFLENNEKAIIVADHTAQGSSNADIKNVTFVSSSIHQIPAELFSTFPNLGILKMEGQNLQEIKPNTFKNAKNLRSLYLGFNKIKLIDETTFDSINPQRCLEKSRKSSASWSLEQSNSRIASRNFLWQPKFGWFST
jgi:hypothetical protein